MFDHLFIKKENKVIYAIQIDEQIIKSIKKEKIQAALS